MVTAVSQYIGLVTASEVEGHGCQTPTLTSYQCKHSQLSLLMGKARLTLQSSSHSFTHYPPSFQLRHFPLVAAAGGNHSFTVQAGYFAASTLLPPLPTADALSGPLLQ